MSFFGFSHLASLKYAWLRGSVCVLSINQLVIHYNKDSIKKR